jgi:hypothetical protein
MKKRFEIEHWVQGSDLNDTFDIIQITGWWPFRKRERYTACSTKEEAERIVRDLAVYPYVKAVYNYAGNGRSTDRYVRGF